jgi:xanthine/CO dehydrogenase XdhC/CoxF family maturation factor
MTHEIKDIIEAYLKAKEKGLKAVLASVVDLTGSSYRKPGVRMLILEDGSMIGAVSGGCVEKDILRQSETVFKNGISKMMTYDGRYRLGCEGVLYILIEIFQPNESFVNAFESAIKKRQEFKIHSYYKTTEGEHKGIGSFFEFGNEKLSVSNREVKIDEIADLLHLFSQTMPPCFKLMIFGTEHDAVRLCELARFNGWEVTVISGPLESKTIDNFPGACAFYSVSPDALELKSIDDETAIVLMSHNFANDLKYLIELKDLRPVYLGMLGPSKRREKILSEFLEYCPDVDEAFLDLIYGPAGLNIGAETPQEIAISILSEILSVTRNTRPIPLNCFSI